MTVRNDAVRRRENEPRCNIDTPTASRLNVRDDSRSAPLIEAGRHQEMSISEKTKERYLSQEDWTGVIHLRRLAKLVFWRTPFWWPSRIDWQERAGQSHICAGNCAGESPVGQLTARLLPRFASNQVRSGESEFQIAGCETELISARPPQRLPHAICFREFLCGPRPSHAFSTRRICETRPGKRQKSFSSRDVAIMEINNRARATFEIPFH